MTYPPEERIKSAFSMNATPMNRLINELMGYDGKLFANNLVAAIK
jgi:hypothetical protein